MLYRHDDTAHPHVHIVTVCVDQNGRKISDTFIKNRMNTIRQELEIRFGLVQAEAQRKDQKTLNELKTGEALQPGRVGVGLAHQQETKAAIDGTIQTLTAGYACLSFADFARLLAAYHIQARTVIRKVNGRESMGLTFRLTDGQKAISPAIKASNLTDKPTYARLLTNFEQAKNRKEQLRPVVVNTLQRELSAFQRVSELDFYATLRQAGVQVLDDGQAYIYVDHRTKTVWNETELGKSYERAFLKTRFTDTSKPLSLAISLEEGRMLGQQVARQYQQYGQQTGIRHESRLIEQFPFTELVQRLRAENVPTDQAIITVRQFEQHKQGQLPLIRAREEAEFRQAATQYLAIAGQLQLSAAGRTAFLKAVDLTLTETGVQHRDNDTLNFPLSTDKQADLLTTDYLIRVSFGQRMPESERVLIQKLAVGEGRGEVVFGPINLNRLQKILPPALWHQASPLVNESQATRAAALPPETDITEQVTQLYQRGWIIRLDGLEDQPPTFRLGHYLTDPATFAALPEAVATRLKEVNYGMVDYERYQEGLRSTTGQQMVRLANVLDENNQTRIIAAKRMIYFVNQNLPISFADDTNLLTALTRQSVSIANPKRLTNDIIQQPEIAIRPDLTDSPIRGIRRN